jgi:hypothetical protein
MKIGPFSAGVAIAAGLLLLAPPPRFAAAAPDNTLGTAMLGALVKDDGTLLHGTGVTGVVHTTTGGYKVTFDRDITDCTFATTPVGSSVVIRAVSFVGSNLQFNMNRVSDGIAFDSTFSLVVFCPK